MLKIHPLSSGALIVKDVRADEVIDREVTNCEHQGMKRCCQDWDLQISYVVCLLGRNQGEGRRGEDRRGQITKTEKVMLRSITPENIQDTKYVQK